MLTATVLRIERISISDGQGMRTVVFLKGCPLRCAWCSTPESWKREPEVYYLKRRCVSCGACIGACKNGALEFDAKRKYIRRNVKKCTGCFDCVDACAYRAQQIYGKEMTVAQVMKEILKDEIFYFHSGGGVTLSGGDVFCYPDFIRELLLECRDAAINTSAELAMFTAREHVEKVIPLLHSFFADIKCMDPGIHKKQTGQDNALILENIRLADKICAPGAVHIRVPMIWDINDDHENLMRTAEFCSSLKNCTELEFLPYHRLGQHAYEQTFRRYALSKLPAMTEEDAGERIAPLLKRNWPFEIRIAGKRIRQL